jgi:U4/U6.U5 tri-snRNP-associated protein 2
LSPHEISQEISNKSKKKYAIGKRANLAQFFSWFLNTMHDDLMDAKTKKSIISDCFKGKVEVVAQKEERVQVKPKKGKKEAESEEVEWETKVTVTTKVTPFYLLILKPPPPPIFKDSREKNFIPQEPLFTLLSKFDGVTKEYEPVSKEYRVFTITKLPKFLIIVINRFTENFLVKEKNRTIITFPLKQLDMAPYLKNPAAHKCTKYNLIANIKHNDGITATEGYLNVHILHKASDTWYDIQDLIIDEIMPPVIALSEAYIQVYERQDIYEDQSKIKEENGKTQQ